MSNQNYFFSDQDRNVSTASKRIFVFVNHLALFILIVIRHSPKVI